MTLRKMPSACDWPSTRVVQVGVVVHEEVVVLRGSTSVVMEVMVVGWL